MTHSNNKGSALVWALVTIFVLVIFIGTTLTMAFSYYNRSLINNDLKQAYFTARSVVDALKDEIQADTANGQAILAELDTVGDTVNIENINFVGDSTDQGYITATVILEETDTIIITATAYIGERTKTVTLRLHSDGTVSDNPIMEEFPGVTIPDDVVVVTNTYPIKNNETSDIYAEANATVMFNNNADYSGNIFAESGVTISINQGSKFNGTIYAESGTIFTFTKLHNQFLGTIYVRDGSIIKVNGVNYTITENGASVNVSPSGMDSDFKSLLKIYSGSSSGDGSWGGNVYE